GAASTVTRRRPASPQFSCPQPSTTCCEAAPRSGPDSRLLAPGRAELNAALGMYSAPYAAGQGYGNYLPYYEIKDGAGTLHSGIAQPATYYSYDHSLGQYQYDRWAGTTPACDLAGPGRGALVGLPPPDAKMQRERRRVPSRPGCTSTAKTPTPPKERKSCWLSSPK
uniref:Uncharacterized protein n=1 Tax=Malurus cyaneus samueli TaxID=2593467 RepID=A0A8C5X4F9_9PASS